MPLMLRHRLGVVFDAWGGALIETSPSWLRRWLGLPSGLAIVLHADDGPRIVPHRGSVIRAPHGRAGRSDIRRGELIPEDADVLRRTLTLPGSALGEIDNLIRLDLPVSTPFEPDDVVYAARITARAGRDWHVAVAILQKSRLRTAMGDVQAKFDAVPQRVGFGGGLTCAADPVLEKASREASRLDLMLCGLAATLAVLVWVLAQQQADARSRMLHAALSQQVDERDRATLLEASIERRESQAAFMAAERDRRRSARAVVAAVAQALEPGARLDSMAWSGNELTLLPRPGSPPVGPATGRRIGDAVFPAGYSIDVDAATHGITVKAARRGWR